MGANNMTTWSPSELERVGAAEELRLASRRRDGNLSRYVTMWVVRARDGLYVRDVTFAEAAAASQSDIDAAYHAKYDRYGPQIVGSVTGPSAHSVTLRLVPQLAGASQE
jgi:hypothetical protein